MPKFHYKAKQSPTQTVQGTVTAENKKSAIEEVSRLGYQVLSVMEESEAVTIMNPRGSLDGLRWAGRGVGLKESTDFARQLADLLESGIPIVRALELLQNQALKKKMKTALTELKEQCVSGSSLSSAMSRRPDIFPHLFVVMSRAGETGGSLDAALRRLSIFNEKQLEIRARLRAALAYPTLMVGVGILTILTLLLFVIPRMAGIFEDLGHSLPLPTQILLFFSSLFSRYFAALFAGIAVLGWMFRSYYRTSTGRRFVDKIKLDLPLAGSLVKKVEIARFSQTLATLLEGGVSILEALKLSADTVNNVLIKGELEGSYAAVKAGARLSAALAPPFGGVGTPPKGGAIPLIVIQMVAVGEESGHLEKTLQKIADNYERETDQAVKVFLSLLEPSLILLLGLVVGFMVIAILLPIFEISLSAG